MRQKIVKMLHVVYLLPVSDKYWAAHTEHVHGLLPAGRGCGSSLQNGRALPGPLLHTVLGSTTLLSAGPQIPENRTCGYFCWLFFFLIFQLIFFKCCTVSIAGARTKQISAMAGEWSYSMDTILWLNLTNSLLIFQIRRSLCRWLKLISCDQTSPGLSSNYSGFASAYQNTSDCGSHDTYSILESPWLNFTTESCVQFSFLRKSPRDLDVFFHVKGRQIQTVENRTKSSHSDNQTYNRKFTVHSLIGKVRSQLYTYIHSYISRKSFLWIIIAL